MAELAPLVDYSVTIDNDGREPRLVTPGQTWTTFSGVWRDCYLPDKQQPLQLQLLLQQQQQQSASAPSAAAAAAAAGAAAGPVR